MAREIKWFKDVESYMTRVRREDRQAIQKLTAMINKLTEKGETMINGRTIKKLKGIKPSVIQIEIIKKKYRIHTVLTDTHLHIINGFDKKSNKTPLKVLDLSTSRAKQVINL